MKHSLHCIIALAFGAAASLTAACVSPQSGNDGAGGNTGSAGGNTGGSGGATGAGGHATGAGGTGAGGTIVGGAGGTTVGGAGGATGTGGVTGGGTGGAPGAGGGTATGAGGGTGSGAGGSAGGNGDCTGLPLCDTFESGSLNTTLWTVISGGGSTSAPTIDTIGAHGSGHSAKFTQATRLYLRNSTVIGTLGPVAHVRFYVRFEADGTTGNALTSGHGAMVVTHPTAVDQYTQTNELRFGSQSAQGAGVFHWNTDADSANIPTVDPTDDALSFKPAPATWYCVELTINTNGNLNVSIDGNSIAGLTEDGVATPGIDQAWVNDTASLARYKMLGDFSFGWDSYGSGAKTLWFDDVALSASPIGCVK
jgi:hypothetical protein